MREVISLNGMSARTPRRALTAFVVASFVVFVDTDSVRV